MRIGRECGESSRVHDTMTGSVDAIFQSGEFEEVGVEVGGKHLNGEA